MTVINTNVKSLIAQASLAANNKNLSTAMERLSTGSRINSAKDDAAGLAISSRMTSQVRGLNMAIRNANDGISLAQTAEGAMEETTSMLQRMRELSLQAANSVNNASDRAALDAEVQQLKAEIDRIAGTTTFNNQNILDGSFSGVLQIGDKASQTMAFSIGSVSTTLIGETAQGAAVGATKASLVVGGASAAAGDYQGVSFNVGVNGTQRTVTLPVASAGSQVNTAGAAISVAPLIANSSIDQSVGGQVGAVAQKTIDLSTATDAQLEIAVNGSSVETVDISDPDYYVTVSAATGAEVVAALQAELDANASFQGANALRVSLDSFGQVNIALASGEVGTITITSSTGELSDVLDSTAAGGVISTTTGSLTLNEATIDVSSGTGFDVGNNHFDLTAAIQANGFDDTRLTVDQFITVYNQTAVVNGNQVSMVAKTDDADNTIEFTIADPSAPGTGSPYSNSLLGVITVASSQSTDFQVSGSVFGKPYDLGTAITIAASTNNVLSLAVDGGNTTNLVLDAGSVTNMADLAAEIQGEIDASGVFTGDNAVTVSASINSNGQLGLYFESATGKEIVVDGSFLSGTTVGGTAFAQLGGADSGRLSIDTTENSVTINSIAYQPVLGNTALTQRTVDLSTPANATFTLDANGTGPVTINVTQAIADREYTDTALTGAQLVTVLNDTLSAEPALQGNNAVTASLNSGGQIVFNVAGGPVAGGNPSLVIDESASGGFVTTISSLNSGTTVTTLTSDSSGELILTGGVTNAEKFGITDVTLANTVTDFSGAADNLKFGLETSAGASPENIDLSTYTSQLGFTDSTLTVSQISQSINLALADTTAWTALSTYVSDNGQLAWSTGGADVVLTEGAAGSWGVSFGAIYTTATSATPLSANFTLTDDVELLGTGATTVLTNNTLKVAVGDGAPVSMSLDTGTYTNAQALADEVTSKLAESGAFTGENAITVTVGVDASGNEGLIFASATGADVAVSGSFMEALSADASTFFGPRVATGGIDLSSDNTLSVSVTKADGSIVSKAIELGSSGSSVSFENYAALLESAANTAFSSDGLSFTSQYANGSFSFQVNEVNASAAVVTGSSVTAAFGGEISGVAATSGVQAGLLASMDDVVAAVNEDLSGAAVASFADGAWTFTAVDGLAGSDSTIALSGDGLAAVQIAGTLTANGEAGNATASRLSDISITTVEGANAAITSIDNAIEYVNSQRAYLGAIQNRLDHTVSNLTNISTNTSASRSRIMDADYGAESASLAKAQIIQQAATAMLAQANQSAQSVLSLLQ